MSIVRKNPEERYQELIEIALKLFIEKGYEKTKVEQICKTVGIAKGTFFYYFPTKKAVLEAIVERWSRDFRESYASRTEQYTAIEKLKAFLELFGEDSPMDNLMDKLQEEGQVSLLQMLWSNQVKPVFQPLLLNMVKQGVKEGTMQANNLEVRMDFFWGIMDTLWDVNQKDNMTEEGFALRQQIAYEQLVQLWGINPEDFKKYI